MRLLMTTRLALVIGAATAAITVSGSALAQDWLRWRGPDQAGTSHETELPAALALDGDGAWSLAVRGRGTPVVHGDRLFAMGYRGEGFDAHELLMCVDVASGAIVWEHDLTDFLSDVVYTRYAIGSPTVDPETGLVYCLSTPGLLSCFTPDGALRWQHSMMEEYGRWTFPNGRTGAPLIEGDLVVVHVATSNWGPMGPTRDRFYAFDKADGTSVWSCTPGGPPKDGSFSFPVVADVEGRRVLYAGLAGGHLVCVDVRTGQPLWRFQMSIGGMSSSPLLFGDTVIAIHGKENVDDSTIGRMVALRRGGLPAPGEPAQVRGLEAEVWRNDLVAFTSSPVLIGERVYVTVATGELCCVDATDGTVLWQEKLAPDQIHASPVWADGKLYVPMTNGSLHVVRPSDGGPEVLQSLQLEGSCLGAPAIAGGRVFVHTTEKLYCLTGEPAPGAAGHAAGWPPTPLQPQAGEPAQLQVRPADLVVEQGESFAVRVDLLDAAGRPVQRGVDGVELRTEVEGVQMTSGGGAGRIEVAADAPPAARVLTFAAAEREAGMRLRVVPRLPFADDFEDAALQADAAGVRRGPARPWWVVAGPRWEIVEFEGNQVLGRTLVNPLFQRTWSMIGHPRQSNYTAAIDVYLDGNRRTLASGGLINQRYLFALMGNYQELWVTSNEESLRQVVPIELKAKTWYRLVTRVDLDADGGAMLRAKAWPRDGEEPSAWTLEVPHAVAHRHGSPGLYGFTPQNRFTCYFDNLTVTPNE